MIGEKTQHEINKISESVYEDPMRLVKDEFHEKQIELAKDVLSKTKNGSNEWSSEENRQAEQAANMVLNRLDGSYMEINPDKARELDRKLEVRIKQAIRDGRIKPADRREYAHYMESLRKKK